MSYLLIAFSIPAIYSWWRNSWSFEEASKWRPSCQRVFWWVRTKNFTLKLECQT